MPLADARLAAMPMGRVKPEVDDLLSSRVSGRLEKEELLDVLRNRAFRQTLLVRAPAPGREEPDPAALDRLHFTTELVPVPGAGPGTSFKGPSGALSTDDPGLVSALRALHEAVPRALPLAALAPGSPEELRPALLRCVAAGLVEARAGDVPCAGGRGRSRPSLRLSRGSRRPRARSSPRWRTATSSSTPRRASSSASSTAAPGERSSRASPRASSARAS